MLNPVSATIFITISVPTGVAAASTRVWGIPELWIVTLSCIGVLIALWFLFALKIAKQWQKAIVLRFARFQRLAGPGMFWKVILPKWAA